MRKGFHLDMGYRFTHMGEVTTGLVTHTDLTLAGDGWTGDIESSVEVEDLYSHEFRFGVRYDIW